MKTSLKVCSVFSIVSAALLLGGMSARAASQTWTNAPVSQVWTNSANWAGGAYPGSINSSGTGGVNTNNNTTADIATFNTPIPISGIGGAALPITTVDSSIPNQRSLVVGGITFDTANCGSYVFQADAPPQYPGTGILFVCHSHAITMNATVTTSQYFMLPVLVRLPASTAGAFSFVNNSTTPSAVMYFSAVTNDSANTRGTVFTLDGSNTGTNTIEFLSKGPSLKSAAMGFTKQGTGTWILPNASDFTNSSVNNLNDGTLIVQNSGVFGVSASVIINSNAVEQLQNVNQTNTTINGNGTIQMNGSGYVNLITVGAALGVSPHLKTTSLTDVLVVGTNTTAAGGSATSVIHISGPGTVLLLTNSTYVGSWSADSGVMQIGVGAISALGTGPNLNVAAGGTVDLTSMGAGVTFNPTTAGVGGSGTGTTVGSTAATIKPDAAGTLDLATGNKNIALTYTPTSSSGDTTHPALYISQGTLNLGGNTITVNNASGTPLNVGTYVLIQVASGNINNAGNLAAIVTGKGVAVNTLGTIQVSGGQVELVVAPYTPQNLSWEGGNPNENWDVGTTPNWFNGGTSSKFNDSDVITFNAAGASNPAVNIVGAVIPGSALVDTTATNYLFGGSGSISGQASLTKMGTGTLIISNMNDYIGNTVISNGTVQLAKANGLSGNSDMTISNAATVDLNANSATIGALNGNGTIDTVAGGLPILTIGNNADSGTFSGTIKNTAGTLAVVKANTGTETLTGPNSYAGGTTISAGILRAFNPTALGTGGVTNTSGAVLDISTNVTVGSLQGVGTVENNSTTTTNELIIGGTSPITGTIADGSGGLMVLVTGTTTFSVPGTYSGGTMVASGAVLAIQNANPDPVSGTGGIVLSNNATLAMPGTAQNSAVIVNNMITADNSEARFTSVTTANSLAGLFYGGPTATNLIVGGTITIGGNGNNFQTFTNFLGTVIVTNGGIRAFGALNGGEKTTFDFIGNGNWNCRDGGNTIHFGALEGDPTATITGPGTGSGTAATPDTYYLGEANIDSVYSGSISGSNNVIKAGTGTLVLNGGGFSFTNQIQNGFETITVVGYGSNSMLFVGNMTVSNGVLDLVAPTELTNCQDITLSAASAVIDGTSMGYISNQFDPNTLTLTNSFPVTNSLFELVGDVPATGAPQTMGGIGTLKAILIADQGSILTPGLPTGVFNVTSNATLSGAITMNLDNTDAPACSEFAAYSITVNPTATLVVTNIGGGLFNGVTYTLFNHGVSGFASVTLPATDPTGGTNYVWQNNLSTSGSITLTSGGLTAVAASPAKFTSISVNGPALTITATNGAASGTFRLLESTNVLLPLAQWKPVLTNAFDANGHLNMTTNVVTPGTSQMYYLLLMP